MNALGKAGRDGTNPPSHEVVDGSASEATLAFNAGSLWSTGTSLTEGMLTWNPY